jgi:hypothetical protein
MIEIKFELQGYRYLRSQNGWLLEKKLTRFTFCLLNRAGGALESALGFPWGTKHNTNSEVSVHTKMHPPSFHINKPSHVVGEPRHTRATNHMATFQQNWWVLRRAFLLGHGAGEHIMKAKLFRNGDLHLPDMRRD